MTCLCTSSHSLFVKSASCCLTHVRLGIYALAFFPIVSSKAGERLGPKPSSCICWNGGLPRAEFYTVLKRHQICCRVNVERQHGHTGCCCLPPVNASNDTTQLSWKTWEQLSSATGAMRPRCRRCKGSRQMAQSASPRAAALSRIASLHRALTVAPSRQYERTNERLHSCILRVRQGCVIGSVTLLGQRKFHSCEPCSS